MKGFERTLVLPPELVKRTLGGIQVEVRDQRARGKVHIALAIPAGRTEVIGRRKAPVLIPYPAASWCRTCKGDCEASTYAAALLPAWERHPAGYTEKAGRPAETAA